MKRRSLLILSAWLLLCPAPAPAFAEADAVSEAASDSAAPAEKSDTMARIKKAHSEMKNAEGQALEAPSLIPESGPVMKNAMFFFALLMIGYSIFKRFTGSKNAPAGSEAIEVLSRKALSSRSSLLIVQVGGQSLLLSQTSEDVRFITELKPQADFEQSIAGVSLIEHGAPADTKEVRSARR